MLQGTSSGSGAKVPAHRAITRRCCLAATDHSDGQADEIVSAPPHQAPMQRLLGAPCQCRFATSMRTKTFIPLKTFGAQTPTALGPACAQAHVNLPLSPGSTGPSGGGFRVPYAACTLMIGANQTAVGRKSPPLLFWNHTIPNPVVCGQPGHNGPVICRVVRDAGDRTGCRPKGSAPIPERLA